MPLGCWQLNRPASSSAPPAESSHTHVGQGASSALAHQPPHLALGHLLRPEHFLAECLSVWDGMKKLLSRKLLYTLSPWMTMVYGDKHRYWNTPGLCEFSCFLLDTLFSSNPHMVPTTLQSASAPSQFLSSFPVSCHSNASYVSLLPFLPGPNLVWYLVNMYSQVILSSHRTSSRVPTKTGQKLMLESRIHLLKHR